LTARAGCWRPLSTATEIPQRWPTMARIDWRQLSTQYHATSTLLMGVPPATWSPVFRPMLGSAWLMPMTGKTD